MNTADWEEIKNAFAVATEMPVDDRAAFLGTCGDSTRLEVEKLLKANDEAGDFIGEPAVIAIGLVEEDQFDFYQGKQVDSYKLLKQIGHGGMGTVYLANRADESFDKQVAVKLIKRGMDTNAVLKRFVMERQILANLEHPNIASLLDGGSTEEGLPYLVMEYVEGLPITKYCDSCGLDTNGRLELFQKVCSAVSYAHSNLVVHRDLKPSNILVTDDGTPKLLDFGIAKLLHPDWSVDTAEATATMFRAMTPEYASPEQIRGLPVTTASDVYSLGVVLYELLSGERPFRVEGRLPGEAAQIVLTAEPLRPSSVVSSKAEIASLPPQTVALTNEGRRQTVSGENNPKSKIRNLKSLRGDLDNIVLKAIRKEPERRYASVLEFSEDIRRHLVNLPITAQADTFGYRTGKFIRRHGFGVAAGLFIFLLVCAGAGATAWQAHRANLEREKAERRFNESRKLSNFLLKDVFDSLSVFPGTGHIQKDLTENTLVYLDNLAKEESGDVVLLGELAKAYIRLSNVQAGVLNDTGAAVQSLEKAVELGRRRMALEPDDPTMKSDLTVALFEMGELFSIRDGTLRSLEVRNEIHILLQEILDARPNSVEAIYGLAASYQSRGEKFDSLRRSEEAKSDYRNALRLIEQAINLSKDTARTPQEKIDLSFKYIWQGEMHASLEDWQNAVASNRAAGEIAKAVWLENPALTQALRNTSSSHNRIAKALEKLGDLSGALENYQFSLHMISEARRNNPASKELKHAEAAYCIRVGTALHKVGETKRAVEMVGRGLALEREYIAENADRASLIHYGFETFGEAAKFFELFGQRSEAVAVYLEWAQYYERLLKEKPQEPDLIGRLAIIYSAIGDVHSRFNVETKTVGTANHTQLGDARNYYNKALNELNRLQKPNPDLQGFMKTTEEKLTQCKARLMAKGMSISDAKHLLATRPNSTMLFQSVT